MNELEKQNIINSFDEVIKAQKQLRRAIEFSTGFRVCDPDKGGELFLSRGIERISKALRISLKCEKTTIDTYPYRYSFYYQGIKVFQIAEKPFDSYEVSDD